MNVLLSPQPPVLPHQREAARCPTPLSGMLASCSRSSSLDDEKDRRRALLHRARNSGRLFSDPSAASQIAMASRKRKVDDDQDEMSVSPLNSPPTISRQLASRPPKRTRPINDITGRPLPLHRLLETLNTTQLRQVLQKICERHPEISYEIVTTAERPSPEAALQVLSEYQEKLRAAFPFGESSSDYTYSRVRQALISLTDAISDFIPQFLPPIEQQVNHSFQFLDGATKIIHELPDWDNKQYNHHKDNAYDEISNAWALTITEAAKRGGGFILHSAGWDQCLAKHNQRSGGKLGLAMNALVTHVGWIGNNNGNVYQSSPAPLSDQSSILNQLLNGTYGSPVRVGPW
ncbi:uncharacterized protein CTHT_0062800 [Thermochaetoides thermophila DSM 1495]|uniref:Tethering factor for nuclear proteasome STS1 n=1 Tax=Chaetomium thermophilum (strain DSM 1495 / CBS 144.50 / IMI 039719) TaxID=759272 RepID=G0SE81_CHATD|nr:hypothetical protein CTHT_0062800 [Thermochaetoides thermophila DSM 1495]EGS18258.1 hypothetical protein CTHT_0062800 [Thermochaetoides thermophila DSM 1495]